MVREGRVLWWERPELWSLAHLGLRSGFIAEESCGLEQVSSGLGGWGCHSWKQGSPGEVWGCGGCVEFGAGAWKCLGCSCKPGSHQ